MKTAAEFSKLATAVGTALTPIGTCTPGGHASVISVEVENVSGATLTGFTVQLVNHSQGSPYVVLADADFQGSVNGSLLFCTTLGPNQIAAGQKAQFSITVGAAWQVIFLAKVAAATAVVNLRGTEQQG